MMPHLPKKQLRVPWAKRAPKKEKRSDERYHTHRWTKFSKWFRTTFPLCAECGKRSEVVDHIVPARLERFDFYDTSNMQPLCHVCHNRKRATEDKEHNTE